MPRGGKHVVSEVLAVMPAVAVSVQSAERLVLFEIVSSDAGKISAGAGINLTGCNREYG